MLAGWLAGGRVRTANAERTNRIEKGRRWFYLRLFPVRV